MSVVKVTGEEQLLKDYAELLHISINLRFWSKYWHEHYGAVARGHKDHWQDKMDRFLRARGVNEIDRLEKITFNRIDDEDVR